MYTNGLKQGTMFSLCRLLVTGLWRRRDFETRWRQFPDRERDEWFDYSFASRSGRHRGSTDDDEQGDAFIGARSPPLWQLETTTEATSGLTCSSFPAATLATAPAAAAAAA